MTVTESSLNNYQELIEFRVATSDLFSLVDYIGSLMKKSPASVYIIDPLTATICDKRSEDETSLTLYINPTA